MLDNKKNNPVVTELFIRGRKLIRQFSFFITQPYFAVPKNIRINSAQYFFMKIPSKRELQQIAFIHLSDIYFEDFMNLYKKCTAKPYSFLWLLVLFFCQIILQVSERIFSKVHKK